MFREQIASVDSKEHDKAIITCKKDVTIDTTHLSVAFFPSFKLCVCVSPDWVY